MDNGFTKLYSINVNEKVEKKPTNNGRNLSYLSWAWAWAEFKKVYPNATYLVLKSANGLPYFGEDNVGYMVYVTVDNGEGLSYEQYLPIMDSNNNAMKAHPYTYKTKYGEKTVEAFDMFDVNKTIQRCLTKCLAMFGLGLYIYAGEDLPETDDAPKTINEPVKVLQNAGVLAEPVEEPTGAGPTTDLLDEKKLLVKECMELGIKMDALARYMKKNLDELTTDDLKVAINMKRSRM